MNKKIKTAKELVKIAKQLVSSLPDKQGYKGIYDQNNKIDMKKLDELWDKYSDQVNVDIEARLKDGDKQATIRSIKKWLKDNGHEDWTYGKKFEAIAKYNEEKMNEAGLKIIKETGDTYIISFEEIIKEIEEERASERVVKGGFPSKQELIQIYKSSQKN